MLKTAAVLGALLLPLAPVNAQSINISFGVSPIGPGGDYGAAAQVGYWNQITGTQGDNYALKDLNGDPTGVTILNFGGTDTIFQNHPELTGGDERLLEEFLVTYTPPLETCLFINGLEPGMYRVITYAWLPQSPEIDSLVRVDFAGQGPTMVGGEWPGGFEEGITHAIHTVEVGVDGFLGSHSGIPSGGTPIAALNGMQIEKLPGVSFVRGDGNGDGGIDIGDPIFLLAVLFSEGGPVFCDDAVDANDDGSVDIADSIYI